MDTPGIKGDGTPSVRGRIGEGAVGEQELTLERLARNVVTGLGEKCDGTVSSLPVDKGRGVKIGFPCNPDVGDHDVIGEHCQVHFRERDHGYRSIPWIYGYFGPEHNISCHAGKGCVDAEGAVLEFIPRGVGDGLWYSVGPDNDPFQNMIIHGDG